MFIVNFLRKKSRCIDKVSYVSCMPRRRSPRRRSNSTAVRRPIETTTSIVATANIVGLICSRMPENICHGIVRCLKLPTKSTTTTSSKEVMKANSEPEITPGRISGTITLKNVVVGDAPRLAEARIRLLSKPTSVAVTVMTTKGVPSAACARITPIWVP